MRLNQDVYKLEVKGPLNRGPLRDPYETCKLQSYNCLIPGFPDILWMNMVLTKLNRRPFDSTTATMGRTPLLPDTCWSQYLLSTSVDLERQL